jgi:hypothetical protein
MEAQELLEHEPNVPNDAEQLEDVNNIAAMDPVTIPADPVVIPEAMSELLSLLSTVDNAQNNFPVPLTLDHGFSDGDPLSIRETMIHYFIT